ncbi:MAG: sigma-70 family RNA polymerase sigma factor [Bacteroidales bacterium]|nr:sigma-70 family RNA polymerase sigma factor [Bacteroidales bacterium]
MYKELDEQTLARYCSSGDRMAGDELYRRYAVRLHTLCMRYTGDDEEAKDLMLETLVRALEKMGTYKYTGKGSLYAWISRIAINKALNQIQRHRWRMVRVDLWERDDIPDPTGDEIEAVPREKLLEWISSLPDLRRAVFNLFCIEGYSHREIGKMLGISETASSSVLAKARKRLKENVRQYLKEREG